MSDEQRKCPYCGMTMAADQRACPDCGNPYPFDDDATMPDPTAPAPPRAGRPLRGAATGGPPGSGSGPGGGRAGPTGAAGIMALVEQYKTILVLVGVLVLIVAVGYLLFQFGMSFFAGGRPDPSTLATSPAGPVAVSTPPTLGASPVVPGASPSPGAGGTVIQPSASPSPAAASGVKMKIANTEGQGANMRQSPATTAPVIRTLSEGTVVDVIGNETNAGGRNWRNVRDPAGATGWVASELLVPAQ